LVFLRKISSPATFDFCNTIPAKADIGQTGRHVCFVPFSTHAPQQGKPHYAKSPGRLGRLAASPSSVSARFAQSNLSAAPPTRELALLKSNNDLQQAATPVPRRRYTDRESACDINSITQDLSL
jgi:hypothetical protein